MSSFLETAIKAAKSAGDLLKEHYYKDKEVDSYEPVSYTHLTLPTKA